MEDDRRRTPDVLDKVESRQARRVGLIWVLIGSLTLAAIVGLGLAIYY